MSYEDVSIERMLELVREEDMTVSELADAMRECFQEELSEIERIARMLQCAAGRAKIWAKRKSKNIN